MEKLRLMHLMGAPRAGGAETFFIRLMAALHRNPQVDVLPVVRTGSWASKRLLELGIPHRTAWFGGWWDIWTKGNVHTMAEDFKPQVVTGWMNRATRHMPQGLWHTVARLGGYYKLKNYRGRVQNLITNTDDIAAYCIKAGWPAAKVDVIGNFIPHPPVGWQKQGEAMRQKLGIPAKAKVLLLAGRLHKVKGIDVALNALASLPGDVHLLLAGEGPEHQALQTLATELGVAARVHWAGWVDSVDGVAAVADIWLVPSRHEPLGNVVLDAWAHNLPVVAAKVAGPLSLITHGENGVLVDGEAPNLLALAVKDLLDDPAEASAMAKAGFKAFREKFSEEVVVAAYVDYYRRLVKGEEAEHEQRDI